MLTLTAKDLDRLVVAIDVAEAYCPTSHGREHLRPKTVEVIYVKLTKRRGREIDEVVVPQIVSDKRKTRIEPGELRRRVVAADDDVTWYLGSAHVGMAVSTITVRRSTAGNWLRKRSARSRSALAYFAVPFRTKIVSTRMNASRAQAMGSLRLASPKENRSGCVERVR